MRTISAFDDALQLISRRHCLMLLVGRFYSSLDHVQSVVSQRLQGASAKQQGPTYDATQMWAGSRNKLLAQIASRVLKNNALKETQRASGPSVASGVKPESSSNPNTAGAKTRPAFCVNASSGKRQSFCDLPDSTNSRGGLSVIPGSTAAPRTHTPAASDPSSENAAPAVVPWRSPDELRADASSSRKANAHSLLLHRVVIYSCKQALRLFRHLSCRRSATPSASNPLPRLPRTWRQSSSAASERPCPRTRPSTLTSATEALPQPACTWPLDKTRFQFPQKTSLLQPAAKLQSSRARAIS